MTPTNLLKGILIWTNPITYIGMIAAALGGIVIEGIKSAKDYAEEISEVKK